ncbi:N-ethylmaleimide sensitive fusion protein attachment protein alpha [Paragonimus heterotremus]|uniref:N-ethylmaleimide sensitive fusion protein attachment protein alpha n=1 Tax=Paragonimus heterotremus TaxID=100268 RepID=A0A8J4TIG9_9TREM|nr:N-ethylmaleimide sensitive fusion protein attachment protein alpha [Paragonimus heterotremus]
MISLYEKAANCFKMAHNWSEAGNAFLEAARLSLQEKSKHDAATHYVNAASVFKKVNPQQSLKCLTQAIEIYTEMGRFTIAAKHHMTIAEIYETILVDVEQAIRHYEQAADYYKGEDSNSSAMKCQVMVAQLSTQLGHYDKAANIFEEAGKTAMENKLLKYGAKDYLFKATICHFCVDLINGQKALKEYEDSYPMFADSRECGLMKKLSDALEQENVEAFTAAVQEYDSITRLDPWITSLLLKLKKTLGEEEDIT